MHTRRPACWYILPIMKSSASTLATRDEAAELFELAPREQHRFSDHERVAEQGGQRGSGGAKAVQLHVFERGAERIFAAAGEQVRDQADVRLRVEGIDQLAQIVTRRADVAVAHHQQIARGVRQHAEQVVDLRIDAAGAPVHHDLAGHLRVAALEVPDDRQAPGRCGSCTPKTSS